MRAAAYLSVLVVFVTFVVLACASERPGVRDISAEQLLSQPPAAALILDVRTPAEFNAGHVPEALNIPYDELASRLGELSADRDTPVVVYCESGGRAGKATSVLLDAGYRDVLHLAGDMGEWRAEGRPMTRP